LWASANVWGIGCTKIWVTDTMANKHTETFRTMPEDAFWNVPPLWDGETVFVIGGGPSLAGLDWGTLSDFPCLGVNDAYYLCECACVGLYGDAVWYETWQKRVKAKQGGIMVSVSARQPPDAEVKWLARESAAVPMPTERKLFWAGNTGMSAINLACLLGARNVVLLGFDMRVSSDEDGWQKANWYENLLNSPNPGLYRRWLEKESVLSQGLKWHYPKTRVVNATPGSAMRAFPHAKLEDIL